MKNIKISLTLLLAVSMFSCTKLDENLNGELTLEQAKKAADVPALLKAAYNSMAEPFQDQANTWALQTHSTDEAIPPTRAGDWDDNGVWRVIHTQTWDADHSYVKNVFNNLSKVVFNATNVLNFAPTAQQAAEAKFIRAFAMYNIIDLYGQVPVRQPGEDLLLAPKVLNAQDAIALIISDINSAINDLPSGTGTTTKANKNAARMLLMKCYLNQGVYANRATPTFAAADMTQVVTLADQIIASGQYSIGTGGTSYFRNFAPNNGSASTENIFTQENGPGLTQGRSGNSARSRYFCTLHYNMTPSGWNGFTTLSDFYDKFEASDKRRGDSYTGYTDVTGINVGFLVGQQFNSAGVALKDRNGAPLSFTRTVTLNETNPTTLEVTGIRVVKYIPDLNNGDNVDNDYVLYRYSDCLLMKAEALLRGGGTGGAPAALLIVNDLRAKRGASPLASITLTNIYDERGRELYWEGWRRQDMIRFGTFLAPFQEKPTAGAPKALLYPIPNSALAVNPNLKQNPGY